MCAEPDRRARRAGGAVPGGAWAAAAILAAVLAHQAWSEWGASSDNVDLETFFLPAARAVLAGQSPYAVEGYYYSPLVAVLVTPLGHAPWAGSAWSAGLIGLALVTCLVVAHWFGVALSSQRRAALFAAAVVTLFSSWPFRGQLILGQTDLLVMATLALAGLGASRGRHAAAGIAMGLAAALKTWPAVLLLWLLRRPWRAQAAAWWGVLLVAGAVSTLALALGGPSVLGEMLSAPWGGTDQPLVAYSAWGAGELLFSDTGLVAPLAVSTPLRVATIATLLAWTLTLLVVVLRRPGPPVVALANVVTCALLALPVAHYTYLVYPLPALWFWAGRALHPARRWTTWAAVAALAGWWLVALYRKPANYPDLATTLPSYLLILGATFGAATVSVVAAAREHRIAGAVGPAGTPARPVAGVG